ncbi:hypothetical protein [Streptacidiphilus albus]|uniref:hypothetical protein n=1 Tax=Streptacidiphilus albus TaxID=105425 RepID=UPI00128E4C0B|nr:hypothetical protein [Streptacidiphilus albus]
MSIQSEPRMPNVLINGKELPARILHPDGSQTWNLTRSEAEAINRAIVVTLKATLDVLTRRP